MRVRDLAFSPASSLLLVVYCVIVQYVSDAVRLTQYRGILRPSAAVQLAMREPAHNGLDDGSIMVDVYCKAR